MKKRGISLLLALVLCLSLLPGTALATGDVQINEETFPDANFREAVRAFDTDKNGSLSSGELAAVTNMNVRKMNIGDLQGITRFQNLEKLDCGYNQLSELSLNELSKLTILHCEGNTPLQYLQVGQQIRELYCNECPQFPRLNPGYFTELRILNCSNIGFSGELSFQFNPYLEQLTCDQNDITKLDLHANHRLSNLICMDNPGLHTIDISSGASLGANGHRLPSQIVADFDQQSIEIIAAQGTFDFSALEYFKTINSVTKRTEQVWGEPGIQEQMNHDPILPLTQTPTKIQFQGHTITLSVPPCLTIDDNHFPDPAFQNFVRQQYDQDGDGYLDVEQDLSGVEEMDCSNLGIRSLTGIEYFPNLKKLNCSGNQLAYVNIKHLQLAYYGLDWSNNVRQIRDGERLGLDFHINNLYLGSGAGGRIEQDGRAYFDPGSTVIRYVYSPDLYTLFTLWRPLLEQEENTVKAFSYVPATLILATYSSSGQLEDTTVHALSANTTGLSFDAGTATRAFLLDAQGMPLCEALDLS